MIFMQPSSLLSESQTPSAVATLPLVYTCSVRTICMIHLYVEFACKYLCIYVSYLLYGVGTLGLHALHH